jgi:predicted amidohydrolase
VDVKVDGMLRVALLQLAPCGADAQANLEIGIEACRRAHELGADIALFPEMWSIGYAPAPEDDERRVAWRRRAIDANAPWLGRFRLLAAELDMAIAVTFLERWAPQPRNTMELIDRRGATALRYAKVHTCDFGFESAITPGEAFSVAELDTAAGRLLVGAMICYDREFPESARILMLQGAELILSPNACHMDLTRIAMMRSRSAENMVALAMTNYPAPSCNGRSLAIDAFSPASGATAPDGRNGRPADPLILQAGDEAGVFIAEFDLRRLREHRARDVWGNAFRRPTAYGLLTSPGVRHPFVRPEARR